MVTCFAVRGTPCQQATRSRQGAYPALRASRPAVSRRFRPVVATAASDRGASGLDIGGSRPTSPKAWEIMATTLKQKGVKFITPQEIGNAQKRGVPVVDIRPEGDYKKGRVPGAVNVEFYRLIAGWSPRQLWRRAGFAFFGVLNGTEVNPDFMEQIEAAAPKKDAIILVCNLGGTLEPTGPSKFGQQSRSLMAAYELMNAGWKNVQVLKGGMAEYVRTERPVEVDDE